MVRPFRPIAEVVLHSDCLFWGLALCFSAYYGYRAFVIQKEAVATENQKREAAADLPRRDTQTIPLLQGPPLNRRERLVVHYIQNIMWNVSGSLIGWSALRVLCYLYLNINNFSEISPGASAIVIFLVFVAVNGIAGTLPQLIMLGRLFGGK